MHLLDTAYHVVHDYPGGPASLAPRLGKSPATLCHEVAGSDRAKLGLVDAAKITQLTGDLRVLYAFAEICGHMCIPLPQTDGMATDGVMLELAQASERFAGMCREVAHGMADGRISDNELDAIERVRGELLTELAQLGESLRQLNENGKPGGAR